MGSAYFSSICHTCKIYIRHRLTLVGLEDAVLENEVTIVVNCYDVGSHIQKFCESDIDECYCVEEFVGILILEFLFVKK